MGLAELAQAVWSFASPSSTTAGAVLSLRGPRVVASLLVGASLGVSGAAMQGLLRNPLADPSLLGVASGAAAAVSMAIVGGGVLGWLLPGWAVTGAAVLGAMGATSLVLRLGRREGRLSVALVLLAGIAVNAAAGAVQGLVLSLATDPQLRAVTWFGLGSFASVGRSALGPLALATAVSVAGLVPLGRSLDALALGEGSALHLGFDVERTKRAVVVLSAVAVGGAVAAVGLVAFVGLVAPHLARRVVGPSHRGALAAAAWVGATLVCLADALARTALAPTELPVGALTSALGAPLFVWLLLRARRALA